MVNALRVLANSRTATMPMTAPTETDATLMHALAPPLLVLMLFKHKQLREGARYRVKIFQQGHAQLFSALIWFIFSVYKLISNLDQDVQIMEKDSYYLFGVGAGTGELVFVTAQEFWPTIPLSKKRAQPCTQVAIFSLITLLIIPQVIQFTTEWHLIGRGFKKLIWRFPTMAVCC